MAKVVLEITDRPRGGWLTVVMANLGALDALVGRPGERAQLFVVHEGGRRQRVARFRADRYEANAIAKRLERDIERLGVLTAIERFEVRPKRR